MHRVLPLRGQPPHRTVLGQGVKNGRAEFVHAQGPGRLVDAQGLSQQVCRGEEFLPQHDPVNAVESVFAQDVDGFHRNGRLGSQRDGPGHDDRGLGETNGHVLRRVDPRFKVGRESVLGVVPAPRQSPGHPLGQVEVLQFSLAGIADAFRDVVIVSQVRQALDGQGVVLAKAVSAGPAVVAQPHRAEGFVARVADVRLLPNRSRYLVGYLGAGLFKVKVFVFCRIETGTGTGTGIGIRIGTGIRIGIHRGLRKIGPPLPYQLSIHPGQSRKREEGR
mmetsp:Transcript_18103/g.50339  ORF Transcript_18103/g.50339 Transcript_18103/m.50339 type:complete len:276 (-) Transcript_18103:393-1220(-)